MIEDFEFDTETGTFTETTSESILPEVVLRLHAQAAGNRGIAGQPPHRGDWFIRPGFGNRCHEARTMSPDIEKQMIGYVNAALSPMVVRRGVVGVEIQVVGRTKNGISLSTEVKLSGDSIVGYTHFIEVV